MLRSNFDDLFQNGIGDAQYFTPHNNTCTWVLGLETYGKWLEKRESSALYLSGPPGCGKTFLAAFLLRHWNQSLWTTHSIAHFFFRRQYEKAMSPQNLLCAILYQLMQLYPSVPSLIEDMVTLPNTQSLASLASSMDYLWSTLIRILGGMAGKGSAQRRKPLILLIDALDECLDTPTAQFLSRLCKFLSTSPFPVKLLVTARRSFLDHFRRDFLDFPGIDIEMHNAPDIELYVHDMLDKTWATSPGKREFALKLEEEIIGRASGIFLWVVLVVECLLTRSSKPQIIYETIRTFPRGRKDLLKRTYEEILRQATDNLTDQVLIRDIKSMLGIVAISAAPMELDELESCLEFEEGPRLDFLGDVSNVCRGLLRIDAGKVRLVHDTLRDYLHDSKICLKEMHIDFAESNARLGSICLKYCADRIIRFLNSDESTLTEVIDGNSFLPYAADNWIYHANVSGDRWTSLVSLIHNLFKDRASFLTWYNIIWESGVFVRTHLTAFFLICGETSEPEEPPHYGSPAHIISLLGLPQTLYHELFSPGGQGLLSLKALGPNNLDDRERTPLHWAASSMSSIFRNFLEMASPNGPVVDFRFFSGRAEPGDAIAYIVGAFPESCESRDFNGRTPLHLASIVGDTRRITQILGFHANVNATDSQGFNPLHLACSSPTAKENAHVLIKNGAKVNAKSNDGLSPLHLAAISGQDALISLLRDKGANFEDKTIHGWTALHYVAFFGQGFLRLVIAQGVKAFGIIDEPDLDDTLRPLYAPFYAHDRVIENLIANGTPVDGVTVDGQTALHIAAERGYESAIQKLLDYGAEIDFQTNAGLTPLYIAIFNGQNSAVNILLDRGAAIERKYPEGCTALHLTAQKGQETAATLLLQKGAFVNARMDNHCTPLHIAAESGHATTMRLLLESGADVDAKRRDGVTPLHVAAYNNHADCISVLVEFHAAIDALTQDERSPLHIAIQQGKDTAVRVLLEFGASPYLPLGDLLAFHLAAMRGNLFAIKLLLERGMDVDLRSKIGSTALTYAAASQNLDVVRTLLEAGARTDIMTRIYVEGAILEPSYTAIHIAAVYSSRDIVQCLLSYGASADERALTLETPLHLASLNANIEVLEVLLEHASELDARAASDVTPLHVATRNNKEPAVELLLQRGATADAQLLDGYTALHMAALNGNVSIVQCLIRYHASVNIGTNDGYTPLSIAISKGFNELVQILLGSGADTNNAMQIGLPPMHLAVQFENDYAIDLLHRYGAPIDMLDHDFHTPLYRAVALNREKIARILLEHGAKPDAVCSHNLSLFHIAIKNGSDLVLPLLCEYGAPMCLAADRGMQPLHFAALRGNKTETKFLLDHGVLQTFDRETEYYCVRCAMYSKNEVVIDMLLSRGTLLREDQLNWSLTKAVCDNNEELLKALTKHAPGCGKASISNVAFSAAALTGRANMTQILLAARVNPDQVLVNDLTALHIAAAVDDGIQGLEYTDGHEQVARVLVDHGASIDARTKDEATPLILATQKRHGKMVKALIELGANVNVKTKLGLTALHIAAQLGHEEIIDYLCEGGADVDAQDLPLTTPLCHALLSDTKIFQKLLDFGASVDSLDQHGRTIFHYACAIGNIPALELLHKKNVDMSVTDRFGRQGIDVALLEPVRSLVINWMSDLASESRTQRVPKLDCTRPSQLSNLDRIYLCSSCQEMIDNVFYYRTSASLLISHLLLEDCMPLTSIPILDCCLCDDDDFDICRACFDRGIRCKDEGHRLSPRFTGGGMESYSEYSPWVAEMQLPNQDSDV
jgi:ankyrin repeat protein